MGTNSLAQSLGGASPEQWATDFLSLLGYPVSPTNVGTVVAWENGESGGGGGKFNPLNTTQGGYGGTSTNSAGVKDYPSYEQGLNATVQAFTSGFSKYGYGAIGNALKAQDQQAAFDAIGASSWGTPRRNLPGGGAVQQAQPGTPLPTATFNEALQAAGQASPTANANPDNDCLLKMPGLNLGVGTLGGGCLVTRSGGRALLGAVAVLGGGVLLIVGIAFVFSATKAGNQVLKTAAPALGAVGAVL